MELNSPDFDEINLGDVEIVDFRYTELSVMIHPRPDEGRGCLRIITSKVFRS